MNDKTAPTHVTLLYNNFKAKPITMTRAFTATTSLQPPFRPTLLSRRKEDPKGGMGGGQGPGKNEKKQAVAWGVARRRVLFPTFATNSVEKRKPSPNRFLLFLHCKSKPLNSLQGVEDM